MEETRELNRKFQKLNKLLEIVVGQQIDNNGTVEQMADYSREFRAELTGAKISKLTTGNMNKDT